MIHKIVLTGGPCAGKSTALDFLKHYFTKQGYIVYTVPETATELMSNGIEVFHFPTTLQYQKCQMNLHRAQEEAFLYAAKTSRYSNKDHLVICDRGQFDCKAYMTEHEFELAMTDVYGSSNSITDIFNSYDAIFHLSTAAKGAVAAYTLDNNITRKETKEEAIDLDNKISEAWKDHQHYFFITCYENFADKMNCLKNSIEEFLNKCKNN